MTVYRSVDTDVLIVVPACLLPSIEAIHRFGTLQRVEAVVLRSDSSVPFHLTRALHRDGYAHVTKSELSILKDAVEPVGLRDISERPGPGGSRPATR